MLFNYKLESDNTFDMINIILTTLKRKIGSHLSLNGCKVTMLSASAWKKIHIIIKETISKSRYAMYKKHRDTFFSFLCLLQHSFSML